MALVMGTYAFENARVVQRERLAALAEALDPGTVRELESIGVGGGGACLEVGAGGGSIAAWLCERAARVVATARDLFTRVAAAHDAALAAHHGFDPHYGRRVAGDLAEAGLTDLTTEGRASMWRGGQVGGALWRLSIVQLREELDVPPADIDRALALYDDPAFSSVSPLVMAARAAAPPSRSG